ncbi:MAG: hypothetical protein ACM3YN_13955 [Parcubacteria group bacterium]
MIIDPADFWRGARLKSEAFGRVRQLIFELKGTAEHQAPRRKSEITQDIAEGVIAGAAHAIAWDYSAERVAAAAALLRNLADQMEADGLQGLEWGPRPAFDTNPVTFPATLVWSGDTFMITAADYPEVLVGGDGADDRHELARTAFEDAIHARLGDGEALPPPRLANLGEVEVAVGPEVAARVRRHWADIDRKRRASA